ncbi:MAG: polysaccharide deacetylase family protein [Candidatus Omnitrophica bacterium]|nr:polysaccharide deacetylase family protein [Candidatus Omnitrophota bacterium]
MSKIRVILGFDCETDVGSWTPFYEGLIHGTPVILELLDKHKITGTFFFTGDSVKKHPEVVHQVKDANHEIGCHTLFHETVGDAIFEIPGVSPLLPEEVENRLILATEWVEDVCGRRPVSFRAPRLFGSTAMINALEKLGYVSDASYPMYYFKDQLRPYHPSKDDWTKTGDLNIVELPNFADLSMESTDPYGRDLDQWPLFRTEGADALFKHIDGYIAYCRDRDIEPFLCFYFHPWEFYSMPQGEIHYGEGSVRPDPFIVKNCGTYAAEQFDLLLKKLLERGAEFFQAKQIAENLKEV